MFKLNLACYFRKRFRNYTKTDQNLKKKILKALFLLEKNPYNPVLKTHKVVTKRYGKKRASKATNDLRIIWEFNNNEVNIIDVLDLGGHSGKDKVYN